MDKEISGMPTKEKIQKTLEAAELSNEQIKERLEALEDAQGKIQKVLSEHEKRIDECSVRR